MGLLAGTRLNGYEIIALVGAGGMGEVYRARDTRLHRDVALKILPPAMAADALAFARFEREAQAVAALSHPNILAVHDFGKTDTASYVVFELLTGATLRERMAPGPLPVRKAIDYARQVADGLAAAHARNITHRDIKPDNLFVTDEGRLKILDFGLAQTTPAGGRDDQAHTMTQAPITDVGTVLGTVGYMAPEQVRGQAVDARADLFALGAVLYEMCTGQRAFKGATPADTMSAVLSSDPPELTVVGHATPPALERIVRRCLEKLPTERFQSARDLSFALDALSSLSGSGAATDNTAAGSRRRWVLLAAVAVVALATGVTATRALWPAPTTIPTSPRGPSLRAEFPMPMTSGTPVRLMLSPDGRHLLTTERTSDGQFQLVVRELATGIVTPVPGGVGAVAGGWSPRSDGFLIATRDNQLRRYILGDGAASLVTSLAGLFGGAAWLADDTVVFSNSGYRELGRVALTGGTVTPIAADPEVTVTDLTRIGQRTDYVLASRLVGGGDRQVVTVRLADGQLTRVVSAVAVPALTPTHLLMAQANGLFAAPFDAETLALTGDPVPVGEAVGLDLNSGRVSLSASDNGVLAYRPGQLRELQFEWLDRHGRSLGAVGERGFMSSFALSPDGARVIVRHNIPSGGFGLRVLDLARGISSPVAVPAGAVSDPIWSADGTRIFYRLGDTMQRQSPLGTAREQVGDGIAYPDATSPDGKWLIVGKPAPQGGFSLFLMAADGRSTPQALAAGPFIADEGSFSPDGRLVSYQSNRSGRPEIYLARFPLTDERWQVSADGGVQARWSADGRVLNFVSMSGRLMRVVVPAGAPEQARRPEELFDLGIGPPSAFAEQYALSGDRVLALRPTADAVPAAIVVINNWWPTVPGTPPQ